MNQCNSPARAFAAAALCSLFIVAPADPAGAVDPECKEIWSGRKVRWIVPNAAGGGYDTYSRLIEPFYEAKLGVEVLVDNVVGASGYFGTAALRDAAPDGNTLGILNGAGMAVAALVERDAQTPNPATDFTLLGRVARAQQVWSVRTDGPLKSVADIEARAEQRPLVFATRNVGSQSFVNIAASTWMTGIPRQIVSGFQGTSQTVLAVLRDDADIMANSFESILSAIEAGDLRPVLQISDKPISAHPSLAGVPLLGGKDGFAAQRARKLQRDPEQAAQDASALSALLGAGRVIAAPRGLDARVRACMEAALVEIFADPQFHDAAKLAKRSLDPADGATARAGLQLALDRVERMLPSVKKAIEETRQ